MDILRIHGDRLILASPKAGNCSRIQNLGLSRGSRAFYRRIICDRRKSDRLRPKRKPVRPVACFGRSADILSMVKKDEKRSVADENY